MVDRCRVGMGHGMACRNIHKQDIHWFGLLSVAMFIVQVLGIVQLSMFVRGRIFLFIFGGEERGQGEKCGIGSFQSITAWDSEQFLGFFSSFENGN